MWRHSSYDSICVWKGFETSCKSPCTSQRSDQETRLNESLGYSSKLRESNGFWWDRGTSAFINDEKMKTAKQKIQPMTEGGQFVRRFHLNTFMSNWLQVGRRLMCVCVCVLGVVQMKCSEKMSSEVQSESRKKEREGHSFLGTVNRKCIKWNQNISTMVLRQGCRQSWIMDKKNISKDTKHQIKTSYYRMKKSTKQLHGKKCKKDFFFFFCFRGKSV